MSQTFDIAVIGGGHAGIEAALAAARVIREEIAAMRAGAARMAR